MKAYQIKIELMESNPLIWRRVVIPADVTFKRLTDTIRQGFPPSEESKNLVMHATLTIKGSSIMFSDAYPGSPFVLGDNISLVVASDDVQEIETWFSGLSNEETVIKELQETFWSKRYSFVRDKFGIGWQFNHQEKKI